MIKQALETALSEQVNLEFDSAYLYLSMSGYFKRKGLDGFANWMFVQYQEETAHALKFFDYVHERNGKISLRAVSKPAENWSSILEVFKTVLEAEQSVSEKINSLVDLSIQEKDHATNNFLQWFISEQVEEEALVSDVLNKIELIGDSKEGLFMLDREMMTRKFVPIPTAKDAVMN